tara:strand:+ start:10047 stop:10160 length:114 start_codon:yes stop_codon:yes gene_type:complete
MVGGLKKMFRSVGENFVINMQKKSPNPIQELKTILLK